MTPDPSAQIDLRQAVRTVLANSPEPLAPIQIMNRVKEQFPHLYGTESQRRSVEKGNCQNLDHALKLPIYNMVINSSEFVIDRSTRPMRVSLIRESIEDDLPGEDPESDIGTVYVLATGTFTAEGRQILKIGHTTQTLESRIAQLYTTGTPFQFKPVHAWRIRNYMELESAMHRMLAPFRITNSREFFTDQCLPFVQTLADLHQTILGVPLAATEKGVGT
jgi:hypothetical protein